KIKQLAFAQGLMLYPMGGTIDGVQGDHILLAPPFICTESDIHEIVERLTHTLDSILPR
ncbi:MAG: aspartate aminotransferase family protein, partial [Alcaligenes sp.]